MALHISSGCFTVMCNSRVHRIRAVASEGSATLNTVVEEKVKLGGSDLKVSRVGIGAWSWGDTTYWNNFEWNGNFPFVFFFLFCSCRLLQCFLIIIKKIKHGVVQNHL